MKTLSVILYDVVNKTVESDKIFPINDAMSIYNDITEEYENHGLMLVNEINVDTFTVVREFATENSGHVFDLILCGGMINGPVKKL
jgi:hypothetical protein